MSVREEIPQLLGNLFFSISSIPISNTLFTVMLFSLSGKNNYQLFSRQTLFYSHTTEAVFTLTIGQNSMSFISEQLTCAWMGAFIYCASKICRVHPIPIRLQIVSVALVLGFVFVVQQYSDYFSGSYYEICRFVLLGFLPTRIVHWNRRERNG